MKRILIMIAIAGLFGACGNNNSSTKTDSKCDSTACSQISVDSFLVIAPNYVGKELTIKGTVDHVCKHGGKRVRLFSTCPSKAVHGEAGDAMGNFKAELEGSDICMTGIVAESKIDMAYVEEYEQKVLAALEKEKDEADMDHKQGVDHHADLDKIAQWKKEIEASEKGYLSNYYMEVSSYVECEAKTVGCCGGESDTATKAAPCSVVKESGTPCSAETVKECAGAADTAPCGHAK